jgi:DNA-binding IclR family transcriptional regulator
MNPIMTIRWAKLILEIAGSFRESFHPRYIDTARVVGACVETILDGFDVESIAAPVHISSGTVSGTLNLELRSARRFENRFIDRRA